MAAFYVGLDVHWRHTTVCMLDAHGKRVQRLTVRGAWSKVAEALQRLGGDVAVCFEASSSYGYLHELLGTVVRRVVVADFTGSELLRGTRAPGVE